MAEIDVLVAECHTLDDMTAVLQEFVDAMPELVRQIRAREERDERDPNGATDEGFRLAARAVQPQPRGE
jgi:hypothetical protein